MSFLKTGAFKNKLINGNFDIWQRGTSGFVGDVYSADRWKVDTVGGGGTGSASQGIFSSGQTAVPGNPEFFLRYTKTVASTSFYEVLRQGIENVRILAGTSVVLTFWAKASSIKTLKVFFRQIHGSGGSAIVDTTLQNLNLTTTWTKHVHKFNLSSLSGKIIGPGNNLQLAIREDSGFSTFVLDIARVQVETGIIETEFEKRNINQELQMAKRYFQALRQVNDQDQIADGMWISSSQTQYQYQYPVIMRINPTISVSGVFRTTVGGTTSSLSSVSAQNISDRFCRFQGSGGAIVGGSINGGSQLRFNNPASFISFDAEV